METQNRNKFLNMFEEADQIEINKLKTRHIEIITVQEFKKREKTLHKFDKVDIEREIIKRDIQIKNVLLSAEIQFLCGNKIKTYRDFIFSIKWNMSCFITNTPYHSKKNVEVENKIEINPNHNMNLITFRTINNNIKPIEQYEAEEYIMDILYFSKSIPRDVGLIVLSFLQ